MMDISMMFQKVLNRNVPQQEAFVVGFHLGGEVSFEIGAIPRRCTHLLGLSHDVG